MPSKRPTIERVRLRAGQAPKFVHGHGEIQPGEFTDVISVEEARRRADFEVVSVPDPLAGTPEPGDEPDTDKE